MVTCCGNFHAICNVWASQHTVEFEMFTFEITNLLNKLQQYASILLWSICLVLFCCQLYCCHGMTQIQCGNRCLPFSNNLHICCCIAFILQTVCQHTVGNSSFKFFMITITIWWFCPLRDIDFLGINCFCGEVDHSVCPKHLCIHCVVCRLMTCIMWSNCLLVGSEWFCLT